jgi:putative ABC transport system permease protein
MNRESGLAEHEIVRVQMSGIGKDENAAALTESDLAVLRGLPGVKSASVSNQVPYWSSSWNSSVNLREEQDQSNLSASMYLGDAQLLDTLGLKLLAGRRFAPDEFVDFEGLQAPNSTVKIPSAIVTQAIATKLFPDGNALGQTIYTWSNTPVRIVGVVEHLLRPVEENGGPEATDYSMLLPVKVPYNLGGNYLIRVTDPARRAEVLTQAKAALLRNNPNRIVEEENSMTLDQMRDKYYLQDKSMAWLLVAVCIALLVVTALGIVGLASFWVQQRTRQIGIRRALGATRGQILRYFQTENFVLATIGIVIGMLLAFGINQLLMGKYELPRLPALYLPVGAVALWLLGQLAVFGPARRAAAVPPAVATRSV